MSAGVGLFRISYTVDVVLLLLYSITDVVVAVIVAAQASFIFGLIAVGGFSSDSIRLVFCRAVVAWATSLSTAAAAVVTALSTSAAKPLRQVPKQQQHSGTWVHGYMDGYSGDTAQTDTLIIN